MHGQKGLSPGPEEGFECFARGANLDGAGTHRAVIIITAGDVQRGSLAIGLAAGGGEKLQLQRMSGSVKVHNVQCTYSAKVSKCRVFNAHTKCQSGRTSLPAARVKCKHT